MSLDGGHDSPLQNVNGQKEEKVGGSSVQWPFVLHFAWKPPARLPLARGLVAAAMRVVNEWRPRLIGLWGFDEPEHTGDVIGGVACRPSSLYSRCQPQRAPNQNQLL